MPTPLSRQVATVIDELFGVPPEALTDDVELADGLQLDSLSLVELTTALEDTFEIRLADGDTQQVHTFGQLVDAIEDAIEQQARSA